jgi:hypothetical protein
LGEDLQRQWPIPETFIIGCDGRIVAHHVGPYDWLSPEMRDALEELIKSKEAGSPLRAE